MSVYLDVKSGKMFNTLAEMKAFQTGVAPAAPVISPRKEEVAEEPKEQEVMEEQEVVDEPVQEEEAKPISVKPKEGIVVNVSPGDMRRELELMGYDGRTFSRKNDEDLAEFYYKAKANQLD